MIFQCQQLLVNGSISTEKPPALSGTFGPYSFRSLQTVLPASTLKVTVRARAMRLASRPTVAFSMQTVIGSGDVTLSPSFEDAQPKSKNGRAKINNRCMGVQRSG